MPNRRKAREDAARMADEPIGHSAPRAPAPLPERESSRGLEGHGFSAPESRVIHRAAGNEKFGVEAQRKSIEEKVKSGKPLTNDELY